MKTVEDAARDYLLEGLSCMNDDEVYTDTDIEEAFKSGYEYAFKDTRKDNEVFNEMISEINQNRESYE